MKKIILLIFTLSLYQASAQVSTFPNSIGIGNGTLTTIPLHIYKDGEVTRLQGVSPFLSFYNGANFSGYFQAIGSTLEIGTKNNYNLNFFTGDLLRMSLNGTDGRLTLTNRLILSDGMRITGPLQASGGSTGNIGDVLKSFGSSTPIWAPIVENPQIGFQAYLSAPLTIPNNLTTDLTGFVENFDDGNAFNSTTGVFTAPSAGLYAFHLSPDIGITTLPVEVSSTIRMYKNNTTLVGQKNDIFRTSNSYSYTFEHSFYVKLNTNDTIIFTFFQVNPSVYSLSLISNSTAIAISGYKVY